MLLFRSFLLNRIPKKMEDKMPRLKIIHAGICFYQSSFTLFPRVQISMFHAHDSPVTFIEDMFEQVLVVDLTGGRFLTTGYITNLKISDVVPAPVNIFYKSTLISLHVIDIIKYFTGWTIYCSADHIGLMGGSKKKIRVITQWFQNHSEAMGLQYLSAFSQAFKYVAGLYANW